jgi:hypothetical protein
MAIFSNELEKEMTVEVQLAPPGIPENFSKKLSLFLEFLIF